MSSASQSNQEQLQMNLLLQNAIADLDETKKLLSKLIKTNNLTKAIGISLAVGGVFIGGAFLLLASAPMVPALGTTSAMTTDVASKQTLVRQKEQRYLDNFKIILKKTLRKSDDQRFHAIIKHALSKLNKLQKSIKSGDNDELLKTVDDIIKDLSASIKKLSESNDNGRNYPFAK